MPHASSERVHNLVGAFALTVTDHVSSALAEQGGLGGSDVAALLLVHHGHVRRLDDLCAPLALSQTGVARLVGRLETAGLVRRVVATGGDRRQVALTLTRSGRARARQLLRNRDHAIAELVAGLPPRQLEQLAAAAEQALAAIAAVHPAPARICRECDEQACDLGRCPVELAETNRNAGSR
jgi:DNA-binding MarR family transcriptional regulator